MPSSFLLVIGHQEGLSWILGSQRMAFSSITRSGARNLAPKDRLFLYTTRGCFSNPGRDEGLIIGQAIVTSTVSSLNDPVIIAGRELPYGCSINVSSLVPLGLGVSVRTLVDRLDIFSENPRAWAARLRRTVVPLSDHDANTFGESLSAQEQRPEAVLKPYLEWFPREAGT